MYFLWFIASDLFSLTSTPHLFTSLHMNPSVRVSCDLSYAESDFSLVILFTSPLA